MELIIDGHNDLPMQLRGRFGYRVDGLDEPQPSLQTDIPRLRAGGVGGQFWSVYVPGELSEPEAVVATMEQIDAVYRMAAAYPDDFAIAYSADHVEQAMAAGKVASLIGIEGGHSLATSLGVLRAFARLGVRYVTLTHNENLSWADSAVRESRVGGLNDEGRAVVREMQRIGVLVDLSHVAPVTMHAALDTAFAPVIFSHSGVRALHDHPRNVPDDVLRRLRDNGGVIQLTFVAPFLSAESRAWMAAADEEWERLGPPPRPAEWPRAPRPGEDPATLPEWPGPDRVVEPEFAAWLAANPRPPVTVAHVADQVEHARDVAGVDHIGLGGDYDGTPELPDGMGDVSSYPLLMTELAGRGWSDDDLAKLANRNILRALREAERLAEEPLWPLTPAR
ncbi:dipeptidase [Paractinoplanes brasiliensis]|uniref:Membrane dipeptidase n=1 Tax=Paractinoplanes brasiliensis TaxID=52695 RepID=A0A4R6K2Z5_9ACTN|nr:dipeptidase [Actinoplanes brasiliensis]TDO42531.1 membrane dipeptidase [Actinoplanes brasiliensis]GID31365.1 membrane dipeptidase [Actinoplanes brasiliensis]